MRAHLALSWQHPLYRIALIHQAQTRAGAKAGAQAIAECSGCQARLGDAWRPSAPC